MSTPVTLFLIDFLGRSSEDDSSSWRKVIRDGDGGEQIKMLISKMRINLFRCVHSFQELNLTTPNIIKNLKNMGFEKPSTIHERCISAMINSNPPLDIICESYLETEKMIAYSIAVLERIEASTFDRITENERSPRAIILVPTTQIADGVTEILFLLAGNQNLRVCKEGMEMIGIEDVIVGTPKFVNVQLSRIDSSGVKILIIDLSFVEKYEQSKNEIGTILQKYSPSSQVCLFVRSNSIQSGLYLEIKQYLKVPVPFSIQETKQYPQYFESIRNKHFYISVEREDWKNEVVLDLKSILSTQILVFCNSDEKAIKVAQELSEKSLTVEGMDDNERESVKKEFRNGLISILITTTAFATDDIMPPVLINYDIPYNNEHYYQRTHCPPPYRRRIVLNFVKFQDTYKMIEIEDYFKFQVAECPMDVQGLI